MKRLLALWAFLLAFNSMAAAFVYKDNVVASFYAEAFHGKKTSNGELFSMYSMTCAHKMLPFNTVIKVTNLSNGKTAQVRVNDRGPFVKNREIDLSKAAAIQLDMLKSGTTKVRLEIVSLGPYNKLSQQTGKKACAKMGIKYYEISIPKNEDTKALSHIQQIKSVPRDSNKKWDIQIGAFSSKENATKFAKQAKKQGISSVVLQITSTSVKVAVKNIKTKDLNSKIDELARKGYTDLVVKERK